MGGPADQQDAPPPLPQNGGGTGADLISDEVRLAQEGKTAACQETGIQGGKVARIILPGLGQLAAEDLRGIFAEPEDYPGIEGLDAEDARITAENFTIRGPAPCRGTASTSVNRGRVSPVSRSFIC